MIYRSYFFSTPLGYISLIANEEALLQVHFEKKKTTGKNWIIAEAEKQLKEYFAGKIKKIQIPIQLQVTDFQLAVLEAVQKVQFGSTITYQKLANILHKPNAARAVGQALAANPIPIIIPCHRVVGKNSLGGFKGGISRKKILLSLEKIDR